MSRVDFSSPYTASHYRGVAAMMAHSLEQYNSTKSIPKGLLQSIDELFQLAAAACEKGEPQNPIGDEAVCFKLISKCLKKSSPGRMTDSRIRLRIKQLRAVIGRLNTIPRDSDKREYPALIALLKKMTSLGDEQAYDSFMAGSEDDE